MDEQEDFMYFSKKKLREVRIIEDKLTESLRISSLVAWNITVMYLKGWGKWSERNNSLVRLNSKYRKPKICLRILTTCRYRRATGTHSSGSSIRLDNQSDYMGLGKEWSLSFSPSAPHSTESSTVPEGSALLPDAGYGQNGSHL